MWPCPPLPSLTSCIMGMPRGRGDTWEMPLVPSEREGFAVLAGHQSCGTQPWCLCRRTTGPSRTGPCSRAVWPACAVLWVGGPSGLGSGGFSSRFPQTCGPVHLRRACSVAVRCWLGRLVRVARTHLGHLPAFTLISLVLTLAGSRTRLLDPSFPGDTVEATGNPDRPAFSTKHFLCLELHLCPLEPRQVTGLLCAI